MRVLVLGAGLIGVTTAWFLARDGHEVTVVDRQPGAALETSFANGGQISVSHAEPWANPGVLPKVLKWLMRDDAPLRFRLRADPAQWRWGLAFLRECLPSRTADNIRQLVRLGIYSREVLHQVFADTNISNDHLRRGILHFYTNPREFEAALAPAALMRELGCDRIVKTTAECVAIEPALAAAADRIVGGTYTSTDESGDAYLFTRQLAEQAASLGVQFLYDRSVAALERAGNRIARVVVRDTAGTALALQADAYVVALGSYSAPLLRPLGMNIPVYAAKGYSVTMPVADPTRAFEVSLTDDEHKLVLSRLGERLRIAGTAELGAPDATVDERRCRAILARVQSLFPGAGDMAAAQFWAGLRPSTPGNVPIIGASRYANLWLNTGHGTLGWTLACGSARLLADLMNGRKPEVDFRAATV